MVFMNRETGKLQVFPSNIPDLGFPPYLAYLRLFNFHKGKNPRSDAITLNQTFDIGGNVSNTDFPFGTTLRKMTETAEEVSAKITDGEIHHYFGGAVIVDNEARVRLSLIGGYKLHQTQQLMVDFERCVKIKDEVLYRCSQFGRIERTGGGILLQRINTSNSSVLSDKQQLLKLGTTHLGGAYFAAVESDTTKEPMLYLLYVKAGQYLNLIALRDIDIIGMGELRGLVLDIV